MNRSECAQLLTVVTSFDMTGPRTSVSSRCPPFTNIEMRPPLPVPATFAGSTPVSRARRIAGSSARANWSWSTPTTG